MPHRSGSRGSSHAARHSKLTTEQKSHGPLNFCHRQILQHSDGRCLGETMDALCSVLTLAALWAPVHLWLSRHCLANLPSFGSIWQLKVTAASGGVRGVCGGKNHERKGTVHVCWNKTPTTVMQETFKNHVANFGKAAFLQS